MQWHALTRWLAAACMVRVGVALTRVVVGVALAHVAMVCVKVVVVAVHMSTQQVLQRRALRWWVLRC